MQPFLIDLDDVEKVVDRLETASGALRAAGTALRGASRKLAEALDVFDAARPVTAAAVGGEPPEERPEEMGDNTVILTADAPEVEGQAPLPTPPEGEANEGPTGGGDVPASFSYPY